MGIYDPFHQVNMWGDSFKIDGSLNSIATPMFITKPSMKNKVKGIRISLLLVMFILVYDTEFHVFSLNVLLMNQGNLLEMTKRLMRKLIVR